MTREQREEWRENHPRCIYCGRFLSLKDRSTYTVERWPDDNDSDGWFTHTECQRRVEALDARIPPRRGLFWLDVSGRAWRDLTGGAEPSRINATARRMR